MLDNLYLNLCDNFLHKFDRVIQDTIVDKNMVSFAPHHLHQNAGTMAG